jgi:L-iditol 2-dehydrogenase
VGSLVHDLVPGDRVTFDSTVSCGGCAYCVRGEANLCDRREVLGVSPGTYRRHGAFAEFIAAPRRIIYKLPGSLSFEQAAMIEGVSVAVHAVHLTPIELGDTAVVVGTGMIGLLAVQAARRAGCANVIAMDIDDSKMELARQMGATHTVKAESENAAEAVLNLTGGRGADCAFECVGAASAVGSAIAAVRKGGTATLVGNLARTVEFPLQDVVTRQVRVQGSCASSGEYPACISLLSEGAIRVEPLISAVAPLEEGQVWFERLYRREPGLMKVMLRP